MYVFGDSLSDTGNVSLATLGLVPVAPYADRSFSNGPVWAQDLAQSLHLPALQPSLAGGTDFAYGGAMTGQTPAHTLNPTDFASQYGQFLTQVPSPQAGALYAVWIGSNDVLDITNNSLVDAGQQQADVSAAVNNEVSVIGGLAAHGAQNLLVLNVPDLGKTPDEIARGPAVAQSATALASLYDSELATALQPLEASGALKIDLVNTFSVLNQVNCQSWRLWLHGCDRSGCGPAILPVPAVARCARRARRRTSSCSSTRLHPTSQAHALLASGIAQGLTGAA